MNGGERPASGGGVGLANIRERLKALYGGRAELIISVPPTGGTCATIKVPYEIAPATPPVFARWLLPGLIGLSLVSLALALALWQKLGAIQEQLARQSADTATAATEARSLARQAADVARDTAARLALTDAKVAESSLQRTQLEELMQSLSRSRDENLVVDIESAVRLAQQQAQLTGSVQPLLAALKTADQRLQRAAQPRLGLLQRAIARDMGRIQATALADTPAAVHTLDHGRSHAIGRHHQGGTQVATDLGQPRRPAARGRWRRRA